MTAGMFMGGVQAATPLPPDCSRWGGQGSASAPVISGEGSRDAPGSRRDLGNPESGVPGS